MFGAIIRSSNLWNKNEKLLYLPIIQYTVHVGRLFIKQTDIPSLWRLSLQA